MTTNPPPDARNARIYLATANVAVMDILSGGEHFAARRSYRSSGPSGPASWKIDRLGSEAGQDQRTSQQRWKRLVRIRNEIRTVGKERVTSANRGDLQTGNWSLSASVGKSASRG